MANQIFSTKFLSQSDADKTADIAKILSELLSNITLNMKQDTTLTANDLGVYTMTQTDNLLASYLKIINFESGVLSIIKTCLADGTIPNDKTLAQQVHDLSDSVNTYSKEVEAIYKDWSERMSPKLDELTTTVNGWDADITQIKSSQAALSSSVSSMNSILTSLNILDLTNISSTLSTIQATIGTLNDLTTSVKSSIVLAINELVTNQGTLTKLSTTVKTSLVEAINELTTNQGVINNLLTTSKTSLVLAINELVTNQGTLSNLTTTSKDSLVNSINELVTDQGALSSLKTTSKDSLVNAINEVFQSASNMKSSIITAITGKGLSLSSDASVSDIVAAINKMTYSST